MESIFQKDLGTLEIRTGPEPAAIGARAYAHGSQIVFAPGEFDPDSRDGLRLLAHEVTHVLQQREGRVDHPFPGSCVIVDDPQLEYEACRMGAIAAGEPPPPAPLVTTPRRVIPFGPGDGVLQCAWVESDAGNQARHKWANMGTDSITSSAPDGWYIYVGPHVFAREAAPTEYYDYTPATMILKPKRVLPSFVPRPQAFTRPPMHAATKGPAYGLQQAEKLSITFSTRLNKVTALKHPTKDPATVILTVGPMHTFGIPEYIAADGVRFFPHKYEFSDGDVLYFMPAPPERAPTTLTSDTPMFRKGEIQELTRPWLEIYDISGRVRRPDQSTVMGEGPVDHVSRYLNARQPPASWHWCHLIAHSMRPDSTAQVRDNLVCGTAGCNGDMINLEAAVKSYVKKHDAKVTVTVIADVIEGWHIAARMSYEIARGWKSVKLYLEPLSPNRTVPGEYTIILAKLEEQLGT